MPVYEYTCGKCGHEFEELVPSAAARDDVACPSCGSKKTARQMSVFAAREGALSAPAPAAGPCGQCGSADGSCPYAG